MPGQWLRMYFWYNRAIAWLSATFAQPHMVARGWNTTLALDSPVTTRHGSRPRMCRSSARRPRRSVSIACILILGWRWRNRKQRARRGTVSVMRWNKLSPQYEEMTNSSSYSGTSDKFLLKGTNGLLSGLQLCNTWKQRDQQFHWLIDLLIDYSLIYSCINRGCSCFQVHDARALLLL